MNNFKQKSLYAILAGLTVAGVAGTAQAVNISPNGTGQVLIYPYYTVRSVNGLAYNSLLSVVNTTASTKSVKIRFREGKNSKEVLDFNIFLSPFDMWTGALGPSASGGTVMTTADASCTIPPIPAGGVEFRNLGYVGDSGGDTLDRTREGYVEIFEMATYSPVAPLNVVHTNALHSQTTGLPVNCTLVTDTVGATEALPPLGGLMGGMQFINVGAGASAAFDAVALDNFRAASIYRTTGQTQPAFGDADPNSAVVTANSLVFSNSWVFGADAVSSALIHDAVLNEYILDTGTNSQTSWVVTFPTKNEYVKDGIGAAAALFAKNFSGGVSCDDIILTIWDREERTPQGSTGVDFSPRIPGASGPQLCAEANIVTFNGKDVFGSTNNPVSVTTTNQNGWLRIGLQAAPHSLTATATRTNLRTGVVTAAGPTTYVGLPVVGFAAFTYTNSNAVTVGGVKFAAAYGLGYQHRYSTTVTP